MKFDSFPSEIYRACAIMGIFSLALYVIREHSVFGCFVFEHYNVVYLNFIASGWLQSACIQNNKIIANVI